MTIAVLDASTIIALLKGERGDSKVADVVADATVGVFGHCKVVSHFIHLGALIAEIRVMVDALPFAVAAVDEAVAREAGALRGATRAAELSLGDRFCLALSKRLGVPAYTADRVWKDVAAAADVRYSRSDKRKSCHQPLRLVA